MVAQSEPVTATARAIERAFGIPAGRTRAYAAAGKVGHDGGRPARYNVLQVLQERDRAADTIASWVAC